MNDSCPINKSKKDRNCKNCDYGKEGLCDYPYIGNQPSPVASTTPAEQKIDCPYGVTTADCYKCTYGTGGACPKSNKKEGGSK